VQVVANPLKQRPEEAAESISSQLRAVFANGAEVLLMDAARRDDPHFLFPFIDGRFGYTINDFFSDEDRDSHQGHYFQGVTEFLTHCRSEFCLWMDVDMLVHRPAGDRGWLDFALEHLRQNPESVHVSIGYVDLSRSPQEGHMHFIPTARISSRCMILRRDRMLMSRILNPRCTDDDDDSPCDTWEALYHVPESRGGGAAFVFDLQPGPWISHPPDDTRTYIKGLKRCGNGSLATGLDRLLKEVDRREPRNGEPAFGFELVDGPGQIQGHSLDASTLFQNCAEW